MSKKADELFQSFEQGDIRALSRLISMSEDESEDVLPILKKIHEKPGHARIIGLTGPPGAGKSTLVNHFIQFLRKAGKKVGVVAVDPVSPFTGGAVLGDRIRLLDHFNDPGVFIRSVSTRGRLGGLSIATRQIVTLMDRFGVDVVFVETVGVGQSEVDVRKIADLTLVVLVPEWGDSVQAMKAGIIEIGDLFLIHKADREGADRVENEIRGTLQMAHQEETPVLKSSIQDLATIENVLKEVDKVFEVKKSVIQKKRQASVKDTAAEIVDSLLKKETKAWIDKRVEEDGNPYEVVLQFRKKYPPGSLLES